MEIFVLVEVVGMVSKVVVLVGDVIYVGDFIVVIS